MLKGTARQQLLLDLRAARQMAVTRHTSVIVAFGDGNATSDISSYSVHLDGNGDRAVQAGELRAVRTLPTGTRLAAVLLEPRDSLLFDMSGVLWPGTGGGVLILAGPRGTPDTLVASAVGLVYRP
jgi:hypothetical protein